MKKGAGGINTAKGNGKQATFFSFIDDEQRLTIDCLSILGWTPLYTAAYNGNRDMVRRSVTMIVIHSNSQYAIAGRVSVQTRRQSESAKRRGLGTAARRRQSRPLQSGQGNGAQSQSQSQHSDKGRHDTTLLCRSHRSSKGNVYHCCCCCCRVYARARFPSSPLSHRCNT
jgi:hypothetical protein